MVLLNAPDAQRRILKSCEVTEFSEAELQLIAKHSKSTFAEIKKASESIMNPIAPIYSEGEKVPVTMFVDDPEQANDIYLEAVKRKVKVAPLAKSENSPIEKTEAETIKPAPSTFKTVMESRINKLRKNQCQ